MTNKYAENNMWASILEKMGTNLVLNDDFRRSTVNFNTCICT